MGGLQDRLGFLLRQAQIWVFRDLIQAFAHFDIRPAHFSVLMVINANPGITQRKIALALDIEPARLVSVLDELERRGLTKRQFAPHDRRARILFLTSKGNAQLRKLIALADEHEKRLLAKLPEAERTRMLEALRAFLPDSTS